MYMLELLARACRSNSKLQVMNELPVIGSLCCGIARGQTLQVTVRKCMAETYFDVFGERSTLFSTLFYQKSMIVDTWQVEVFFLITVKYETKCTD